MPSPTTVLAVVTKAMLHLGAVASGEQLNANEAQDGLDAFNDVLETWSLDKLAIYGSEPVAFNTVAGQRVYTVGIGGNWSMPRPVSEILDATCTINGVEFPIAIWTQAEYDQVALKSQPGAIVTRLLYLNDFPFGKVILWPVPNAVFPVTINATSVLTNATSISQSISYPPGYARALQYAVALELMAQYGGAIDVSVGARATYAKLKRANRTPAIARFDPTLLSGGGGVGGYGGGIGNLDGGSA